MPELSPQQKRHLSVTTDMPNASEAFVWILKFCSSTGRFAGANSAGFGHAVHHETLQRAPLLALDLTFGLSHWCSEPPHCAFLVPLRRTCSYYLHSWRFISSRFHFKGWRKGNSLQHLYGLLGDGPVRMTAATSRICSAGQDLAHTLLFPIVVLYLSLNINRILKKR